MGNGTSEGERQDDSFVDRLGDRISSAPPGPKAPAPPSARAARPTGSAVPAVTHLPPPQAVPVLGPADFAPTATTNPTPGPAGTFNDEDSTALSRESDPPPPIAGTLPEPAEPSGLHGAPPIAQPPPSRPDDAFAEFEASEMPGESTRIEESEIIADQSTAILDEGPKMPFLFVESGKDKGKEYVLQEGETGVGRGIDNDVILTDVSVSRKHLRVLRDGASLVLRDLGSGNGTTVNGKRVHQMALTEGDRIELGETVLVVRLPGDGLSTVSSPASTHETALPSDSAPAPPPMIPAWGAPQPAPISASSDNVAPRDGNTATVRLPRKTLVVAVVGVAALALLVGVGVGAIALVVGRGPETTVAALPTGPAITSVPILAQAPPSALPPVAPAPTGAVATVLPATVVPPTVVAVPVTGMAPATGVPVPPTSVAPSTLAPAAPVAMTAATPPAPAPTEVAVADVAPERAPEPTSTAATGTARTAPRATTARTPRATREPTSPGAAGASARIAAAYNTGDFDGAAAIARDAARHASGAEQRSLEAMANNIDSFAGLYPRIHAAGDALGPVAGTVPIALRLDRQIVSGGHYAREIQPRYVRYLVAQARGQIGSAPQTGCPRAREALELDSGSSEAQGLVRQCETTASRMLSDAQAHERSDAAGAQRSYQQIQQMVPRTSATYRTAQERLTALRRTTTHPVDEDE